MNVVLWARVSSREQKEGYSIDAQLRAMRDKAAKHGWTIVREFVIAESAKRGADRKAFNEMLRWVKRNAKREKIDAIFAHKLDRVCRNMRDAVRLQELEDDHAACKLTFVENQFGPGAGGRVLVQRDGGGSAVLLATTSAPRSSRAWTKRCARAGPRASRRTGIMNVRRPQRAGRAAPGASPRHGHPHLRAVRQRSVSPSRVPG